MLPHPLEDWVLVEMTPVVKEIPAIPGLTDLAAIEWKQPAPRQGVVHAVGPGRLMVPPCHLATPPVIHARGMKECETVPLTYLPEPGTIIEMEQGMSFVPARVPVRVNTGDTVLCNGNTARELSHEGKTYWLMHESDIIAIYYP